MLWISGTNFMGLSYLSILSVDVPLHCGDKRESHFCGGVGRTSTCFWAFQARGCRKQTRIQHTLSLEIPGALFPTQDSGLCFQLCLSPEGRFSCPILFPAACPTQLLKPCCSTCAENGGEVTLHFISSSPVLLILLPSSSYYQTNQSSALVLSKGHLRVRALNSKPSPEILCLF